jgi:hypothetical protein
LCSKLRCSCHDLCSCDDLCSCLDLCSKLRLLQATMLPHPLPKALLSKDLHA